MWSVMRSAGHPRVSGEGLSPLHASPFQTRFTPVRPGPCDVAVMGFMRDGAVHPRISGVCHGCGRRMQSARVHPRLSGASRSSVFSAGFSMRFTPVHPGPARNGWRKCQSERVHPRLSGACATPASVDLGLCGSPPYIRGLRRPASERGGCGWFTPVCPGPARRTGTGPSRLGFIPVYPGPARCISVRAGCLPVHPRVSGACTTRTSGTRRFRGSSPCIRGLSWVFPSAEVPVGFTPAYPGSACYCSRRRKCRRFIPVYPGPARTHLARCLGAPVHPRMSGACRDWHCRLPGRGGSSPYVRGLRHQVQTDTRLLRFIPVCPGKAVRGSEVSWSWRAVHPRVSGGSRRFSVNDSWGFGPSPYVRGLHADAWWGERYALGSSPCSRGLLSLPAQRVQRLRFIPVFPGSASHESERARNNEVHPRMSGVCATTLGHHFRSYWFIPVFPGSAGVCAIHLAPLEVHPRVPGVCPISMMMFIVGAGHWRLP